MQAGGTLDPYGRIVNSGVPATQARPPQRSRHGILSRTAVCAHFRADGRSTQQVPRLLGVEMLRRAAAVVRPGRIPARCPVDIST